MAWASGWKGQNPDWSGTEPWVMHQKGGTIKSEGLYFWKVHFQVWKFTMPKSLNLLSIQKRLRCFGTSRWTPKDESNEMALRDEKHTQQDWTIWSWATNQQVHCYQQDIKILQTDFFLEPYKMLSFSEWRACPGCDVHFKAMHNISNDTKGNDINLTIRNKNTSSKNRCCLCFQWMKSHKCGLNSGWTSVSFWICWWKQIPTSTNKRTHPLTRENSEQRFVWMQVLKISFQRCTSEAFPVQVTPQFLSLGKDWVGEAEPLKEAEHPRELCAGALILWEDQVLNDTNLPGEFNLYNILIFATSQEHHTSCGAQLLTNPWTRLTNARPPSKTCGLVRQGFGLWVVVGLLCLVE